MKAVGYKVPGPIAEDASLVDIDLPRPVAEGSGVRGVLPGRPADAPLQQVSEPWMAPGAVIVAPGRVKNASFPVGSNPRPRFRFGIWC